MTRETRLDHADQTAQRIGASTITVPAETLFRGVIRLFHGLNCASVTEMPLANGRRADVVTVDAKGQITIVEVKSCLNDFQTDAKWPDYTAYCDRFYFAVAEAFPREVLPIDQGLIIADGFGGAIIREAQPHPLAAARRKAMTLRFARLAAARLNAPNLSAVDAGGFVA